MPNTAKQNDAHAHWAVDAIVHLGAGRCRELAEHVAAQPRRVILVEADPSLARALEARTAGLSQVQVMCVAVAGRPGPATFHRYNLSEVSSLRAAGQLRELFPGLRLMDAIALEAHCPVELLVPLELRAGEQNWLTLDVPGEELAILEALRSGQLLDRFSRVTLHCGKRALYEGGETAEVVLAWLQEEGFTVTAEDSSQDPERPRWMLERDSVHALHCAMQHQIAELTARFEEQIKLTELQNGLITQLTEENEAAARVANEAQREVEKLTHALEEQSRIAEERDTLAREAGELEIQVQSLTHTLEEKCKLVEMLQQDAEDRDAEADQVAMALAAQQAQTSELQQEADERTKTTVDARELAQRCQQEVAGLTEQLTEQCRQTEYWHTENQRLERELAVGKARIEHLEGQLIEQDHRQHLLDEEFVKAEAQIDLIKDILFREKAFD